MSQQSQFVITSVQPRGGAVPPLGGVGACGPQHQVLLFLCLLRGDEVGFRVPNTQCFRFDLQCRLSVLHFV